LADLAREHDDAMAPFDGENRGSRVKVYGCSPGCLLMSLLLSLVLSVLLTLLVNLPHWL
jgi:hypothetical protein